MEVRGALDRCQEIDLHLHHAVVFPSASWEEGGETKLKSGVILQLDVV